MVTNLQTIRSARGLTQGELAERAGVHITQIARFELGTSNINNCRLSVAVALAKALDCKPEDLLNVEITAREPVHITETLLLDHYDGMTNGLDYISEIDGNQVIWNYRRPEDEEGYSYTTTDRAKAERITLAFDRSGSIALDDCAGHPALDKMHHDLERIVGTEL